MNSIVRVHFDNIYNRVSKFGLLYLSDWICCSFARKIGLNFRTVRANEVDFRFVKRRYGKLAKCLNYDKDYEEGSTIWLMWWQGAESEKPILIERCIESIKKNRGVYKVVVIDKNNYKNYISIPRSILEKQEKGVIGIAAFSDYIRFSLMEKYGGWYLDATVYVTQPIKLPRGSFYSGRYAGFIEQIPQGKWTAYLWYLPKGHPLAQFVHRVFDDYWAHFDTIINYFLIDCIVRTFYECSPQFKAQIDSLTFDNPDLYFLQNAGLEEEYDEAGWKDKCSNNQFFKCNRKIAIINGNSYAGKILGAE